MKSIRNTNNTAAAADWGARVPSDTINALSLAASTQERTAIPSGASFVIITSTSDIYALAGNSSVAAAVATDVTDGTASELNPGTLLLDGTHTHISVISEVAAKVTFAYYSMV